MLKDNEKALLPKISGDQNNLDDQGRIKASKSSIVGQAFLGSKFLFHDSLEDKDYLASVSEFSSDGQTVYLVVHFDEGS